MCSAIVAKWLVLEVVLVMVVLETVVVVGTITVTVLWWTHTTCSAILAKLKQESQL